MEYKDAVGVIESCAGFSDIETPVGEAWDIVLRRVARLEGLVQTLLDEDPNETIADNGSTVLCAWRYDARRALEEK